MAENVQLVFRGEVLDGFAPDDVRRRLAQALRLDDGRAARLFSGQRTVLNREIDHALGKLYVDQLAQLGARVHLEPIEPPAPPPARRPPDPPPVAPHAAAPAPAAGDFPPLPELPPADAQPPVPPWGVPPRPTRPAPLAALPIAVTAPSPTEATAHAASAPLPPVTRATAPGDLTLEPVAEVTCPNCGQRQTRRLLCRQCSTNLEMALAHQAEESTRAREARIDAMNARAGRRPLAASRASDASGPSLFGLGLEGRMGRLQYATANTVSLALMYIPLIMLFQRPTLGRFLLFGAVFLVMTLYGMRLAILRCHDCDKTGWWSLLLWLPTVNLVVSLVLALAPGSPGVNEYGEPPPRGSGWALAVALFCLALLLALTFSHVMRAVERMAEEAGEDDRVEFQADPLAASLPTAAQQAAFNERYLPARLHKAFAISPAGAWGWVDGRGSPSDAAHAALQECDSRRAAYTQPCFVVNINGQWAASR